MENEEIIEPPWRGTAGLTSVNQIIDSTDSVSFSNSNTTCALPEHLYPSISLEKLKKRQLTDLVFPPLLSRSDKLRKALEDSIKRNKSILRELARY